MYFIPAIWFLVLTFLLWRKHEGYDACVYIASLYALTSVCAVVIILGDMLGAGGILFSNGNAEFGFVPTMLYCVTLTITLLPFHFVYDKDVSKITVVSPFLLDCLSALFVLVSIINLYLVADSTLDILSGDLKSIRDSVYMGEETPAQLKAETMPFIVKFLYYFNTSTLLCLPILFYNMCFRKRPWWWNLLLFFASLSMPIVGIQSADRTEMIYYALMLVFTIILFRKHLTKGIKRAMAIIGIPILILGIVYIAAVSQSRFEKQDGGAAGRNLQYAGQGYVNFCYFWENANYEELAPEREFPLIHHYAKHVDSNANRRKERSGQQGFFISVFASFIGDVMLDITPLGMMVWAIMYMLIGLLLIGQSHKKEFDISEILLLFLMACVPCFGIFYYRFFNFTYTFCIILAIAYYIVSRYRIRL